MSTEPLKPVAFSPAKSLPDAKAEPAAKAEPEPLVADVPPSLPYPVEALGPLREAVEVVQGMTQAPVAIPAASALAAASLAVQGFADVETLGGARPVSLYLLTVAQSGERKSSCDEPFMAALRQFEKEQARGRRDELFKFQNAHEIWKDGRDSAMRKVKNATGEARTAAQADLEALGPEPVAPPNADRTVTEPTLQGLTRLLAEGQPSLGLFSDEGGQFLGGFAMNKDNRQATLAALNDIWQGNPIRRTRSGDGHATIYGRRLAVHLMVQPGVARGLIADPQASDTGFLARFLMCEPASTIGTRLYQTATQDIAALDRFTSRLRGILATPMPMDPETRELQPRTLSLSRDARALLIAFYNQIEVGQAKGGDLAHVTGAASKAAEQAARIAGVLTLWHDLHAPDVSSRNMADAIALAQFYLSEASRLGSAAAVSAETERAEILRRWLLEGWEHPDVVIGDVQQYGPNAVRGDAKRVQTALSLLEAEGWIEPLPTGTIVRGKARRKAWRITGKG